MNDEPEVVIQKLDLKGNGKIPANLSELRQKSILELTDQEKIDFTLQGPGIVTLAAEARIPAGGIRRKSSLGENIKRLCKEAGWTPYRLAKETGFEPKLISGHIKGKNCRIGTLKKYAEVFSKGCNRKVSIGELDSKLA